MQTNIILFFETGFRLFIFVMLLLLVEFDCCRARPKAKGAGMGDKTFSPMDFGKGTFPEKKSKEKSPAPTKIPSLDLDLP